MHRAVVMSVLAIVAPAHAATIEIQSIHFGNSNGTKLDLIDDFSAGNVFTEMAPVQPATSVAATTTLAGPAEFGGHRLVGSFFVNNATNAFTGAPVDQSVEVNDGTFRITSRNDADIFRAAMSWQEIATSSAPGGNDTQVGTLERRGHGQSVDYTRGGQADGFIITVSSADIAFSIRTGLALEFNAFLPSPGFSGVEVQVAAVNAGSPVEVFVPFTGDGSVPAGYANIGFHQGFEFFATVPPPSGATALALAGLTAARRRR
ncbi:MAG: hypothetical protein AAGI53_15985 [Planctomycetota bacterium]